MTFSLARRQLGTANRYLIGGGLCLLLGLSTTAEQTLLFNKWLLGADSYRLEEHVSGTIRVQGYGGGEKDSTANLIRYWEEGFAKFHPNIRFENHLKGSASALAGLYTQTAEVAFLSREPLPVESDGFEEVFHYKPFAVEVAVISPDAPRADFVPVVLVHRDNPISQLTLTQLDAIFGSEHRRGSTNIRTWDELGLQGEWKGKSIRVYGLDTRSQNSIRFFEQLVMSGSRKWNCTMREFLSVQNSDGARTDAGKRSAEAVARDRFGIALSSLVYRTPSIKPLALAAHPGRPYFEPTTENVFLGKYPLTRAASIFVKRAPGAPIDPKVKEFLRYILSSQGQGLVTQARGYLPLNEDVARQQLAVLE